MTAPDTQASSTLRYVRAKMSGRSRGERGAAMVEYALLLGLIGLVAVVAVGFFGTSLSNLFTHANSCLSTSGDTSTQSGTSQLSIANSSMSSQLSSGNQLSTGLQVNSGNPPDAPACATTANNGNQQQILQLLR